MQRHLCARGRESSGIEVASPLVSILSGSEVASPFVSGEPMRRHVPSGSEAASPLVSTLSGGEVASPLGWLGAASLPGG